MLWDDALVPLQRFVTLVILIKLGRSNARQEVQVLQPDYYDYEKKKARDAAATKTQKKQHENALLTKGTKSHR